MGVKKASMDWSKIVDWLLSGALIIWFFKWQTNQINMRKLFAETVSKSRMEWITSFRNEIGIIVAAIKMRNHVIGGNCCGLEAGKGNVLIVKSARRSITPR